MLNKILCLVFAMVIGIVQSQTDRSLTIKTGPEYNYKLKSDHVLSLHTLSSGHTGSVRENKKHYLLDIFDQNLNPLFSQTIQKEKKERFIGELFDDKTIKFFTELTNKKMEPTIFCHVFDLSKKTYKKVVLLEKKEVLATKPFSKQIGKSINFTSSENGKYFAMSINTEKVNKVYVYNCMTLALVFEKEYGNDTNRYLEPNDIFIDNTAVVYALGKEFGESLKDRNCNQSENYIYHLYKITKDDLKFLKINSEGKSIKSLAIHTNNKQLQLTGLYAEKFSKNIAGGCTITVDQNLFKITETKVQEFKNPVTQSVLLQKNKRENDTKDPSSYIINTILKDNHGNTYLLAEEFFLSRYYISNSSLGGYCQTFPNYNDIFVLKFTVSGELLWGRSILKKSDSNSYNAFLKGNDLHVILKTDELLEEKKGALKKADKKMFEGSTLCDFSYSPTGELLQFAISNKSDDHQFIPNHGTFENNTFTVISSGSRKNQIIQLK